MDFVSLNLRLQLYFYHVNEFSVNYYLNDPDLLYQVDELIPVIVLIRWVFPLFLSFMNQPILTWVRPSLFSKFSCRPLKFTDYIYRTLWSDGDNYGWYFSWAYNLWAISPHPIFAEWAILMSVVCYCSCARSATRDNCLSKCDAIPRGLHLSWHCHTPHRFSYIFCQH